MGDITSAQSYSEILSQEFPDLSNSQLTPRTQFELRLVYRILRQISDWALVHFYSEVYVEGAENIEEQGALILTPCHHNEIIDIATLSATVPHRRFVTYWTKASLFKNPISRFILSSAGSIPVARVSDKIEGQAIVRTEGGSSAALRGGEAQEALFTATYQDLARGGALGVFPEGTSYTMPRILQIKEGAARAALGFARLFPGKSLSLVPVGIVYTNKSKYRSRVIVRYGERIPLHPFITQCSPGMPGSLEEGNAVRRLTNEVECGLLRLTINAGSWDMLYATRTARDILWNGDKNIPLPQYIDVSKALLDIFEEFHPDQLMMSLLRYHALQYHTEVIHEHISHIPLPVSQLSSQEPSTNAKHELTPSSVHLFVQSAKFSIPLFLSLPVHITHLAAYAFGSISASKLAGREEEAVAQYKVIFGGVGRAFGTFLAGHLCWKAFRQWSCGEALHGAILTTAIDKSKEAISQVASFLPLDTQAYLSACVDSCTSALGWVARLAQRDQSSVGKLVNVAGSLTFAWLIVRWHARIIDGNCERFQRLRATLLILRGQLIRTKSASKEDLDPYYSTPLPPINPYIAKALSKNSSLSGTTSQYNGGDSNRPGGGNIDGLSGLLKPKSIPKYVLMEHLLHERSKATRSLYQFFREANVSSNENGGGESRKKAVDALEFVRECGVIGQ